jgi:hypothetical protein
VKYHCATQTVGEVCESVLVTTVDVTDKKTREEYEDCLMAEFHIRGPVTEEIAIRLAKQYANALETCDENAKPYSQTRS